MSQKLNHVINLRSEELFVKKRKSIFEETQYFYCVTELYSCWHKFNLQVFRPSMIIPILNHGNRKMNESYQSHDFFQLHM